MIRWGDATPEVFSEEERRLVLAALERFGWLNNPCLVCGKESFVVLQGFVMPALRKNLPPPPMGMQHPSVSSVIVAQTHSWSMVTCWG